MPSFERLGRQSLASVESSVPLQMELLESDAIFGTNSGGMLLLVHAIDS
jgi:hypothetical protein